MPQRSNSLKLATIPTFSEVPGDATVFTLRPLRGSSIPRVWGDVLGRAWCNWCSDPWRTQLELFAWLDGSHFCCLFLKSHTFWFVLVNIISPLQWLRWVCAASRLWGSWFCYQEFSELAGSCNLSPVVDTFWCHQTSKRWPVLGKLQEHYKDGGFPTMMNQWYFAFF